MGARYIIGSAWTTTSAPPLIFRPLIFCPLIFCPLILRLFPLPLPLLEDPPVFPCPINLSTLEADTLLKFRLTPKLLVVVVISPAVEEVVEVIISFGLIPTFK